MRLSLHYQNGLLSAVLQVSLAAGIYENTLQYPHFQYKGLDKLSRLMTKPTKWHVCPAKT